MVYGITISRELCFVRLQPLIHVSPSEAYQFEGLHEGAEGLLKTWAHYRNGIYLMKKSSLITNQRLLGNSDKKQWITFFLRIKVKTKREIHDTLVRAKI